MTRVLFTGGGGAGSEAVWRLLREAYEPFFADSDTESIDPGIPEDRRCQIPPGLDVQFPDAIQNLVRTLAIDFVVPGVDEELLPIAKLVHNGSIRALLPPMHFVERNLDKLACAEFLAEKKIAAPRTVLAEKADEIGFPCIVKPRCGRGSRGVVLVDSAQKAASYMKYIDAPADSLIAQEFGQGQEYTVLVSADSEGALRAIVPVAVELKRGITIRATTSDNEDVLEVCRNLHAADPVSGCYNVQLIREADGRILIFEINPRVSTTLCLGIAAGVDPVAIYLGASGERHGRLMPYRAGIRLRRNWINHISEPANG